MKRYEPFHWRRKCLRCGSFLSVVGRRRVEPLDDCEDMIAIHIQCSKCSSEYRFIFALDEIFMLEESD